MTKATATVGLLLALVAAACSDAGPPPTTSTTVAATSAPAPPASAGFTGADGVRSVIEDTSRIVTLSGDLTEIVFELGLGDSVVATDVTTVHPAEALALPIIGVGRFLTAEAVLSQQPTLVVGDTQSSPQTAIEQIRSAGVPVVITSVATSFDDLYAKIRDLGVALGVPERGTELAMRIEDDVAATLAAASPIADPPRVAFVYSRGPDVMLLFGDDMSTRPVIEAVGGLDAGADTGIVGTVAVTPEALAAAAPEVIVTTQEGLDALGGVDGLLAQPGFAATPAGVDRAIIAYPEGDVLTFGPRIAESLALFIRDLRALQQ